LIGVEDSGGNYTATDAESVFTEIAGLIGSSAPNVDVMTFYPEYPNVVVYQDGATNQGKLETNYDLGNLRQYYNWTTQQTADQDIDLRFRYVLPADFSSTGDLVVQLRTKTNATADNSVTVIVQNETDTATCHTDDATAGSVGDTWDTLTISIAEIETGCTGGTSLDAGDLVELQLKLLADNTSSGYADVGSIAFAYSN